MARKKRRRLDPGKFTVRLVAPGTYPDLEPNPGNPYTMLPDETRMRLLVEDLAKLLQDTARGRSSAKFMWSGDGYGRRPVRRRSTTYAPFPLPFRQNGVSSSLLS